MFNRPEKFTTRTIGLWGWNLFWWKIEGMEVLNGVNVYKLSDPKSAGFVIKIGRGYFRCRYSKVTGGWHIRVGRFVRSIYMEDL